VAFPITKAYICIIGNKYISCEIGFKYLISTVQWIDEVADALGENKTNRKARTAVVLRVFGDRSDSLKVGCCVERRGVLSAECKGCIA